MEELIAEFDYTHINKSPAVFDMNKPRWMNGEYRNNFVQHTLYEVIRDQDPDLSLCRSEKENTKIPALY